MAQVASETKSHALRQPQFPSAQKTLPSDRAPSTPFADLIDSNQPQEPRPQRADDKPARTERSEPRQDSRRSQRADGNRPARNDDHAVDDKAPAKAETASDAANEAGSDVKTTETTGKTDENTTTDDSAAQAEAQSTAQIDTVVTAIAVVIDPAAASAPAKTGGETEGVLDAVASATMATAPQPVTGETPEQTTAAAGDKGQADLLVALQAKAGKAAKADAQEKAAGDSKASDKTAPVFDTEGILQSKPAGEPDKTVAHASAETSANHHRGVTPEAPAQQTADNPVANAASSKPADALPPQLLNIPSPAAHAATQAAAPMAAPHATHSSEPAVPVSGVGVEIASKALSGKNQFDIRLDPPDLGRIHVRLDVDRDGNVITHMVADRSDTLDLLRRDTSGLERALQDAGLKTSDNSLQFSLRDQSGQQQGQNDGGNRNAAHIVVEDEQLPSVEATLRDYSRYSMRAKGLDIRV